MNIKVHQSEEMFGEVQLLFTVGKPTVPPHRAVEKMIQKIDKDGFASAARETLKSKDGLPPTTIEEALEQSAEAGTHSILDIHCISPTPQPGAATPLSETQLQTLFGTTQPTKAMIQAAEQGW